MSTKEKRRGVRLPRLVGWAESGVGFLLGGILAGAEMFGQYSPFGVAVVAAAGSGLAGFCTTAGTVLGYLCLSGLTDGMRYGAAAILTYSVAFAFYDARLYRSAWFMPSIASLLTAATGFVCRGGNGWHGEDLVYFATEILFTGVAAWCYRTLFQNWPETLEGLRTLSSRQQAGLLMLGSTVLMSLARVELLHLFSLGRLMAAAGVMLCARRGAAAGVLTGACAGVALDLASGEPPYCSLVFSLAGLACGLCRDKSRISAALAYIGTASVAVLWVEEGAGIPLESVLGSVLFLILPDLPFAAQSVSDGERETVVTRRLMGLSKAYRSLHESMEEALSGTMPENPAEIFTRTADRICGKCVLRTGCWQKAYQETREIMNNATGPILERGRALVTDFPVRFSENCLHFPAFLGEVNKQLTEYLRRRQTRKRQEETQTMLCQQYARMDSFLQRTAAECSAELTPETPGERFRAVASLLGERKRGEEVSGDTGLWFRRGDGVLCFLLCDGMGSGEAAQEESRRCASLLENFLRAGMEPEAAMETVATALALRGEGTSTVDLLTMDLRSGQCAVYKQGASPTWVRQGKKLRCAVSSSLPAGSTSGDGAAADCHAFQGGAGDWVVLLTDGVLCGGEADWLREFLLSYEGADPRELAEDILRYGEKRNQGEDDATVLVIHLEEN